MAPPPLNRRAFLTGALAAAGATLSSPLLRAAEPPLVFGVVPYLTARRLAQLFEPIRAWFASELSRPVVLESAPNYRSHFERTAAGTYDFIATTPYFGRIAQLRHQMVALARPSSPLEPLLVVLPDSPLQTVADLRGKRVATSDPWANLTLVARRFFRDQGWQIGHDLILQATGSHANSYAHLQQRLADAAVVSVTALKQLNLDPTAYRILMRFPPSPPLLYLAHERLGSARIVALRDRLIAWSRSDGAAVFDALGHGTLQPIGDEDCQALEPFVAEFDQLFAQSTE